MASALTCNCTPPHMDGADYDDYTKYTLSTTGEDATHASSSSEDSEVLNQPYEKVTPLFRAIERENWEAILTFLTTGRWTSGFFSGFTNEHMRSPAPSVQVKTWVTAYDRNGVPEWSQLPLHAAISYSAPQVVIEKLIKLYPKAIQCTDNEGMLPIHLAYGFGASDHVLALLLDPFPTSINEKGLGGRYPYECCELGSNKIRGKVLKTVAEQITNRVTEEIDRDWKDFAMAAQESVGVANKIDVSQKTLHEFVLELLKDRKELQDIKRSLRSKQYATPRPSNKSTAAVAPPVNKPASPRLEPRVSTPRVSSPARAEPAQEQKKTARRGWGKKFNL